MEKERKEPMLNKVIENKNSPIVIKVIDDKLTISIGVSMLCKVVQFEEGSAKILNEIGFVNDIAKELRQEDDDGTSMIHLLFDQAAEKAIESGSQFAEREVNHEIYYDEEYQSESTEETEEIEE